MSCKIGITRDPEGRREHYRALYRTFKDWRVLEVCETRRHAELAQARYVTEYGGVAVEPDPSDAGDGGWHVYLFAHGRRPTSKFVPSGLRTLDK